MKKIYLSVVCLLISIPLIAQLYVEPEKEVECSVFLAKDGGGHSKDLKYGMITYSRARMEGT
jgi:hypothetical protein